MIREILVHLGEPTSPPRLMPARGPPLWEMQDSGSDTIDPQAQHAPDDEFDQRMRGRAQYEQKTKVPEWVVSGDQAPWARIS